MIEYLSIELLIEFHDKMVEEHGGLKGIRDLGLLISAMEMPKACMFGVDLHPTIYDKAAAYLFHIACNHPFNDGNKRTAAFASESFLNLNGCETNFTDDLFNDLILKVAKGEANKEEIAKFFKDYCEMH